MRKIYFVYTERFGEVEGIFRANGEMLGCWCNNDASWRNEYFSPFMHKLGYDVRHWNEDDAEFEGAVEKIRQHFGFSSELPDDYHDFDPAQQCGKPW